MFQLLAITNLALPAESVDEFAPIPYGDLSVRDRLVMANLFEAELDSAV
jgi:hypothetical protein